MNVTYKNFPIFFDEFKQNLPRARFLAFDFELTGIATSPSDLTWDLPFERYNKMRIAANKYNIIQVGLALFIPKKIDSSEKEIYEIRPYNIYVFPRENSEFSPQISCDASAMQFNIKHGMNWQSWIEEGVTYIPKKICKRIMDKLMKEKEEYQTQDQPSFNFPESQQKVIDENIEKLEKWINEETTETFSIHENNGYKRSYYYCYLDKHHKELTTDTLKKGSDSFLQVMRLNDTQAKAYYEEKRKAKLEKFENDKGFTRVFELISESKIPIVGHNCFFDLLFWMRHFHNLLSSSYTKYKHSLNKYFPKIYDTKYIGNNSSLKKEFEKSSSLSDYHKSILFGKLANKNLEFDIPFGFEGYRLDVLEEEEGKAIELENVQKVRYHEAGYDAFLTGISFLHFEKTLNLKNFEKLFENKLNVMNSFFSLNCGGKDEFKQNSLVFVLVDTNKQKDYKKILKEVELAYKDLDDAVWIRVSFYDHDHPVYISLKEGSGGNIENKLSEELSNYFNINKKKEMFMKIIFQLKKEYNIMSFSKFIENKAKNPNSSKKKTEEVFDI